MLDPKVKYSILRAASLDDDLTPSSRRSLCTILDCADNTGTASISYTLIAQAGRVRRKTSVRDVDRLEQGGYLTRITTKEVLRRFRPNTYALNLSLATGE